MNFPFIATLLLLVGLLGLIFLLFLSAWRYRARTAAEVDPNLPPNLQEDFGPRLTSARLRWVRWAFALAVLAALGFHFYWGLFVTGPISQDQAFTDLKARRDQRNRREVESTLRGWIYDRHHDNKRALARYRYLNGEIKRDYPLGAAASHVVGFATLTRGEDGLERAVAAPPKPKEEKSLWQKITQFSSEDPRPPVGQDLVLTIDADLQRAAAEQLQNKRGAVVMLNPQTGEILALVSSPSFDADDINNDATWGKLQTDVARKPLLNRAMNEYYLPGSTFKTVTAAAAIEARLEDKRFTCRGEGWTPPGSGRPIRDDEGESHGTLGLLDAFTVSCNQYFAQLGVEVERQRMGEAAARFGLQVFPTGAASLRAGNDPHFWNTENPVLSAVLAPRYSTFVAGGGVTKYDIGLESIGQGYVQLTPIEMAMVAGAAANKDGNVMKPMIEMGRPPIAISQAMSAQTAAKIRTLMASVVQRGTAAGTFGGLIRNKINAGGKTGTAQRTVPEIDPQTGRAKTYVDRAGKTRVKMAEKPRIDSWFIGFAPVENPQIAWAVIVEEGGYGSKTSAPIAGHLLLKARELDLIKVPQPQTSTVANQRR
ncbi:MAG TPA: penicillin-binding transpeptidase domain-containing protein [Blastocatellia bacterium]|nr:penicillin-binding transpeptidase domain-containing protein [Blastocatellia bacterium]HMX24695.1 penicillin-binding transpeptidase domain-containing protein [Blastocatellia bacterium]HMZ17791.1 penicillin-binding transpeptidase domain-containing protein [Blastocatellia bacterium]HNG34663.1 penicillin-binding transpeptidase domain-containing protein [Blastocatellia bacterium]